MEIILVDNILNTSLQTPKLEMRHAKEHTGLLEVLPDPVSLIESMRAVGYTLEAAIADLIDNSISAGGTAPLRATLSILGIRNTGIKSAKIKVSYPK